MADFVPRGVFGYDEELLNAEEQERSAILATGTATLEMLALVAARIAAARNEQAEAHRRYTEHREKHGC